MKCRKRARQSAISLLGADCSSSSASSERNSALLHWLCSATAEEHICREDIVTVMAPQPSVTSDLSKSDSSKVLDEAKKRGTVEDKENINWPVSSTSSDSGFVTTGDDESELAAPPVTPRKSVSSPAKRKPHTPPTEFLLFTPESLKLIDKNAVEETREKYTQLGETCGMAFKLVRSECKVIKTMLHAYGFTQCSSKNSAYNITWTSAAMKPFKMRGLLPWQRLNQFPRSTELTRKDRLYENLARSQALFGDAFDFIPEFFVTPREFSRMEKTFELESHVPMRYIVKPIASSRGRGIFFITKPSEVPVTESLLVSRYIDRPLTVNDHKFDLRIYVAVTSFYPLVAYVYTEGLTRLASAKYSTDAGDNNEFVHLTNYSINKNSSDFIRNESMESEDFGHKWTLGALLRHLNEIGIDSQMLMLRIEDLVVKSLLSVQNSVSSLCRTTLLHNGTNFQLFGFDVLIDEQLKPWLLEVNLSPSLACDAPLDSLIKPRLVSDLLNLACVPLVNSKVVAKTAAAASASSTTADSSSDCTDTTNVETASIATTTTPPKIAVKRKANNTKVERHASPYKSPARTTSAVDIKYRKILKRVRMENERKGDFIRVFPRKGTMEFYKPLMEHVGNENYDARLYGEEFGEANVSAEMSARFHDAMMMTSDFPTFESLPADMRQTIGSWYEESKGYAEKITKEGEVYAAKLPTVRVTARLRTKSCSDFYEVKNAELREKRNLEAQQQQEQQTNAVADSTSAEPTSVPAAEAST